jgi:aspartyl/glutamyl-tRNA(Asn/Gln) amidotransferase C subunit
MAVVTPDIVAQVARLARLRLEGPALTQFAAQLDEILAYVQRLQAVETGQVHRHGACRTTALRRRPESD